MAVCKAASQSALRALSSRSAPTAGRPRSRACRARQNLRAKQQACCGKHEPCPHAAMSGVRLGDAVQRQSGFCPEQSCGPCTIDCPKESCPRGCEKGFGFVTVQCWTTCSRFFEAFEEEETRAMEPPFRHGQRVTYGGAEWRFDRYHKTHGCVVPHALPCVPAATLTSPRPFPPFP